MQKNPENSLFDAQNNNKSAPKCFCCKYSFQGIQKHQNLKFDLLTIFLPWNFNDLYLKIVPCDLFQVSLEQVTLWNAKTIWLRQMIKKYDCAKWAKKYDHAISDLQHASAMNEKNLKILVGNMTKMLYMVAMVIINRLHLSSSSPASLPPSTDEFKLDKQRQKYHILLSHLVLIGEECWDITWTSYKIWQIYNT